MSEEKVQINLDNLKKITKNIRSTLAKDFTSLAPTQRLVTSIAKASRESKISSELSSYMFQTILDGADLEVIPKSFTSPKIHSHPVIQLMLLLNKLQQKDPHFSLTRFLEKPGSQVILNKLYPTLSPEAQKRVQTALLIFKRNEKIQLEEIKRKLPKELHSKIPNNTINKMPKPIKQIIIKEALFVEQIPLIITLLKKELEAKSPLQSKKI